MALAWAAHHWKYCFREQRSLVTFAYNCAHIVPRNLVNRVVGAHFSFIVLKQRNHEVKLPLARPHCPAMAGRRRVAEPAGVYRSYIAGQIPLPDGRRRNVPIRPGTFTWWPDMTLTSIMVIKHSKWYLQMSETLSMPISWLCLCLTSQFCSPMSPSPKCRTFWLWPDLWRHSWPRGQYNLFSLNSFSRTFKCRLNF